MRRERVDHTLETGGLVNEAWIRLAADGGPDFKNRNHFFAIAAGHMRQILVDHARRHNAQKRGGAAYKVTLSDVHAARSESGLLDVIAVHEAMTRFAELDPRACRILEMHLFAGMRQDEIADVLGLSIRTVRRDLMAALAWLRRELGARKNRASR
jgi:RNA polymerase sigma factor (TIGR02999 family)